MYDERTTNLQLPLPHAMNLLEEDVERIRTAFNTLDTVISGLGRIQEKDLLPETLTPGTLYSIPDDQELVADSNVSIKTITVSETDVQDDQIQNGQLVIVPAQSSFDD